MSNNDTDDTRRSHTNTPEDMKPKVTIQILRNLRAEHKKFSILAIPDYPFAKIAADAGIDTILVGDSLGMTVYGYQSLLPVTMDMMILHAEAVRRAAPNVFLVGDLPFLSYEVDRKDAILNAGRFMSECGCDAVKLEGGRDRAEVIKAIVSANIPVVGHIGFTPQAMATSGGFVNPGQDIAAAQKIIEDAHILEDAGICMLMLEAVPSDIATIITEECTVPVCGFGSGPNVDGQILLLHDLLGMFDAFTNKFSKKYVDFSSQAYKGITDFIHDVQAEKFPTKDQYMSLPNALAKELRGSIENDTRK